MAKQNIMELASDLSCLFQKPDPSSDPVQEDKTVQVKRTENKHAMRRVLSELALEKELPWHFEQGVSYHCISFGDVDALTYLRVVVKQQRLKYALISSWCIASEDIAEVRDWITRGYIGRVDWYVGEIFKASYYRQYEELQDLCRMLGGRVAICRNHSKIMVMLGERFDCVVESSANVKNFFDGIKSFERNFDDVTAWQESD